MSRIEAIGIVIPARDEAERIAACLASLRCAIGRLGPLRTHTIVVDDGSRDGTALRARGELPEDGAVLRHRDGPNVGAARRFGVESIMLRFAGVAPAALWLAFTDADTTVPVDWLERQRRLGDEGIDAVAGIVELDACSASLAARFRESDGLGIAGGSHRHVHGANLGVRASAYESAGGFSAITRGEDNDLWSRLRGDGAALASDPRLVVMTSSRTASRTVGGFATNLAVHAAAG